MGMSVNAINCSNIKFKSANKPEQKAAPDKTLSGVPLRGTKRLNYSPATIGLMNGFCWFGVGMLFDKGCSKLLKSKVNTKLSLAIQGALGLVMGVRAYKIAKNESKQA